MYIFLYIYSSIKHEFKEDRGLKVKYIALEYVICVLYFVGIVLRW